MSAFAQNQLLNYRQPWKSTCSPVRYDNEMKSKKPSELPRVAVSVVIVSHNSSPLLVECVLKVLASSIDVEVIVSDNDSTDGSIEVLDDLELKDRGVRVVRNGRNLGFAAANNRALALAGGEYVLFLNPDCLVLPDTIARMVAALAANPDAGMAGCLIRNPDGSIEENCLRRMPTPTSLLAELLGRTKTIASGSDVEAISGAFMLVRRSDLDRLGSFDEGYFLHWEDLDLCRRFRDAGRKILFVPDVEVVHFKGRSSDRRPVWVEWQKHKGLMRFLRKFHLRGGRVLLYPAVAAAIGGHFLLRAIASSPKAQLAPEMAWPEHSEDDGREVWVFGATSLVGRYLLPRLLAAGYRVRAFSRDLASASIGVSPRLTLRACDINDAASLPSDGRPSAIINLAPIFAFSNILPALGRLGVRNVIAFGSTSAFTKADSTDEGERSLAMQLSEGEAAVRRECEAAGMRWVIFRPTMIYSFGIDRNVTRLAGFIRRFRFFVLPGEGKGLRQPVHADDLAKACLDMLAHTEGWNRAYDLSGGETLTYRTMIEAIFRYLGQRARIIPLPDGFCRAAVGVARLIPGYRNVNLAMLKRVDKDMNFPHDEATRAFGFMPRKFLS